MGEPAPRQYVSGASGKRGGRRSARDSIHDAMGASEAEDAPRGGA